MGILVKAEIIRVIQIKIDLQRHYGKKTTPRISFQASVYNKINLFNVVFRETWRLLMI